MIEENIMHNKSIRCAIYIIETGLIKYNVFFAVERKFYKLADYLFKKQGGADFSNLAQSEYCSRTRQALAKRGFMKLTYCRSTMTRRETYLINLLMPNGYRVVYHKNGFIVNGKFVPIDKNRIYPNIVWYLMACAD
jgi:hypothetical protein